MTMYDGPLDDVAINVRTKSRKTSSGLDLANSPVTRAFLEGGRKLAENELMGGVRDQMRTFRPLGTLTKKRVIDEAKAIFRAANRDESIARALYGTVPQKARPTTKPSAGTLRDRWDILPYYLGDLVRYVLRERYSLTDGMLDEATRAELRGTAAFSAVVDKIAYEDMKIVYTDETSARFQYLMTGLADFHTEVRDALNGVYEHSFGYWRDVYAEILDARGVSLRPGDHPGRADDDADRDGPGPQPAAHRHRQTRRGGRPPRAALGAGQGLPDPDRRCHRPRRRPGGDGGRRRADGRTHPV